MPIEAGPFLHSLPFSGLAGCEGSERPAAALAGGSVADLLLSLCSRYTLSGAFPQCAGNRGHTAPGHRLLRIQKHRTVENLKKINKQTSEMHSITC